VVFLEQIIWVYLGVIIALFALVAVGFSVVTGNEHMKEQEINNSIFLLKERANFVCYSEIGTSLLQKVTLGSGVYLSTGNFDDVNKGGMICINYNDYEFCESINCKIPSFYDLNLNKPELEKIAYVRDYSCNIERVNGGIKLECKG
jgi:hypothetical protein